MSEAHNPLSEATATSLDELFSRDPAGYIQRDLDAVVTELRRMAEKWKQEEAAGAKVSASGKAATKAAKAPKPELNDLGDLGL